MHTLKTPLSSANSQSSHQQTIAALKDHLYERIIGQPALINSLLIALLADGHLLVEGVPGLAKTTAIKELAAAIEGDFHRIQFTPDLLPADLTGHEIYRPQTADFVFKPGPVFHNLLLADEINRAPAKVQSALLEAMAERQVTIGNETYPLPPLFLVMATQNPIEHEGTYPLPESQLDRFLMSVKVGYPSIEAEHQILRLARYQASHSDTDSATPAYSKISQDVIIKARQEALCLHMGEAVENYILQLVAATRCPASYGEPLSRWLQLGASPRATIGLDRAARVHAWLGGQDYVSPQNIQAIAHDVLRHRIILSFEAEAEGLTCDNVITELLNRVAVP